MLLLDHVESKSLCTVACIEVPREDASGFGVMDVDENRKITRFLEKPADPPGMPDNPDKSLASMGIYVFNADYLYRLLDEDCGDNTSSHDFGKDIIPKIVGQGNAMAHYFSMSCVPSAQFVPPYWRDVGTIDSFWSANLDLTSNMPQLNISGTGTSRQIRSRPTWNGWSHFQYDGLRWLYRLRVKNVQFHPVFQSESAGLLQSRSGSRFAEL